MNNVYHIPTEEGAVIALTIIDQTSATPQGTQEVVDEPKPEPNEGTQKAVDEPKPEPNEGTQKAVDEPKPEPNEGTQKAVDEPKHKPEPLKLSDGLLEVLQYYAEEMMSSCDPNIIRRAIAHIRNLAKEHGLDELYKLAAAAQSGDATRKQITNTISEYDEEWAVICDLRAWAKERGVTGATIAELSLYI